MILKNKFNIIDKVRDFIIDQVSDKVSNIFFDKNVGQIKVQIIKQGHYENSL